MISTSCYKNWQSKQYYTVAIHESQKDENYSGRSYLKLAPKKEFVEIWKNNIGVISEEENNKFYVQEYYHQVLAKLDPAEVYSELDYSVLLSDEDNTEFSHRHIVAAWLEILLDITVPEQKAEGYNIKTVDRPEYIKEYLDEAMRLNRNMRGFTSLRALYLFEKGEELEAEANRLEEKTGECFDDYRQSACYFRCDADQAEFDYRKQKLIRAKRDTKQ